MQHPQLVLCCVRQTVTVLCCVRQTGTRRVVSILSKQINPFIRQSRERVFVCVCVHVCVCVRVCKLRKLLVCLICNFCIFNNCSLSSKIYNTWYRVLWCGPCSFYFLWWDNKVILNLESWLTVDWLTKGWLTDCLLADLGLFDCLLTDLGLVDWLCWLTRSWLTDCIDWLGAGWLCIGKDLVDWLCTGGISSIP